MPERRHRGNRVESIGCAIVTISDTRTTRTDESGALIRERLESAGHRVLRYEIVSDDPVPVRKRVVAWKRVLNTEPVG